MYLDSHSSGTDISGDFHLTGIKINLPKTPFTDLNGVELKITKFIKQKLTVAQLFKNSSSLTTIGGS
jgi:hypothetical protein